MAILIRTGGTGGGNGGGDAGVSFDHIPANHVPYVLANGQVADSGIVIDGRDIVTEGSVYTGPSSLYLGDNFRVSNGVNAVSYRLGNGVDAIGLNVEYDNTGSETPKHYQLGAREDWVFNTTADTTITTPWTLDFSTDFDNLLYDFRFIPATAGEFHVQFRLGHGGNGVIIFDEVRTVTQAEVDAGVPINFDVGNKIIMDQNSLMHVSMTGIDLLGVAALPAEHPYAGQRAPYYVSETHRTVEVANTYSGFLSYDHAGADIVTTRNVWTNIVNDTLGAGTTEAFAPLGITDVWDETAGAFDFSQLTNGDQVSITHTFDYTPATNNQSVMFRHTLGAGGAINVDDNVGEIETGAGVAVRLQSSRTLVMSADALRVNPITPQVMTSGAGTLSYIGCTVSIIKRGY